MVGSSEADYRFYILHIFKFDYKINKQMHRVENNILHFGGKNYTLFYGPKTFTGKKLYNVLILGRISDTVILV